MGEEKWRCSNVGYSPLYYLEKNKFNLKQIEKKFSLNQKPLILFTLHPIITSKPKNSKKEVDEIFKALKILSIKYQIIVTYPNFDPGYKYIITKINNLKNTPNVKIIKHLGRKNYHALLYFIGKNKKGFCMGNSSSGIKEAVVFNCPTINIGDRQKSRLKPNNVIDVDANKEKIIQVINTKMKSKKKIKNPYKIKKSFNKLPENIFQKFLKKDFKLKKCTV